MTMSHISQVADWVSTENHSSGRCSERQRIVVTACSKYTLKLTQHTETNPIYKMNSSQRIFTEVFSLAKSV